MHVTGYFIGPYTITCEYVTGYSIGPYKLHVNM